MIIIKGKHLSQGKASVWATERLCNSVLFHSLFSYMHHPFVETLTALTACETLASATTLANEFTMQNTKNVCSLRIAFRQNCYQVGKEIEAIASSWWMLVARESLAVHTFIRDFNVVHRCWSSLGYWAVRWNEELKWRPWWRSGNAVLPTCLFVYFMY